MKCDNFINARIRAFHDTDQVWKNIGHSSTWLIWYHGSANPVGADRYNISFSQCMKMTVLMEIKTIWLKLVAILVQKIGKTTPSSGKNFFKNFFRV